jgi:hypothetical protein
MSDELRHPHGVVRITCVHCGFEGGYYEVREHKCSQAEPAEPIRQSESGGNVADDPADDFVPLEELGKAPRVFTMQGQGGCLAYVIELEQMPVGPIEATSLSQEVPTLKRDEVVHVIEFKAFEAEQDGRVRELAREAKKVVEWFDRVSVKQFEQLGQGFERACEEWPNLYQEPLDFGPLKQALQALEQGERQEGGE